MCVPVVVCVIFGQNSMLTDNIPDFHFIDRNNCCKYFANYCHGLLIEFIVSAG